MPETPDTTASKPAASVSPWVLFLSLWFVVTAYNLLKPYNIDDPIYVVIAEWINHHPLHPLSGLIPAGGTYTAIHTIHHPPLYMYMLAVWGRIFGFSGPALHALHSLVALACIVLFYRIARRLVPSAATWATVLLILGPAFIVEQNLMIDVPLLAAWLAFFCFLIHDLRDNRQTRRFVLAALACSAALLIKYSSVVLLPILWFSLVFERRRAQAWTAAIPVLTIIGWALFNRFDYGGIHMFTRAVDPVHFRLFKFTGGWIAALGALTPLGMVAAVQSKWAKSSAAIYAALAAIFALFALLVLAGVIPDRLADRLLPLVFAANGVLVLLPLVADAFALPLRQAWRQNTAIDIAPQLYLLLWVFATTLFYILFVPFIAARHILLVLPPVILLLLLRWGSSLRTSSRIFAIAFTLVLSTGLCISDWNFAQFFRHEAAQLARNHSGNNTIWTLGGYGWQWYSDQDGLRELNVDSSPVRVGDQVAVYDDGVHLAPQPWLHLSLLRTDGEGSLPLDLFCTGRPVRFYLSPFALGPWSVSRNCGNQLSIYQVEAVDPHANPAEPPPK